MARCVGAPGLSTVPPAAWTCGSGIAFTVALNWNVYAVPETPTSFKPANVAFPVPSVVAVGLTMPGLPVLTDAVTTIPAWDTRLPWLSDTISAGCTVSGTLLVSFPEGCVVIARNAGGPAISA